MKHILTIFLFLSGITLFGQSTTQNSDRKVETETLITQADTLKTTSNVLLMARNFKMTLAADTLIYDDKKSATSFDEKRNMNKNP